MPIIRFLQSLDANRRVRAEARNARKHGMTDRMRDSVFASVLWLANSVGDEDATEQYARQRFDYDLRERLPGLDPATILLLVQLAVMIYQALKAAGFLQRDGLQSVNGTDINEYFGGL